MVLLLLLLLILLLGLDRYRYAASADTGQYWSVLVSANTYLSIDANISSPVVRLPVSTVNTVATHAYSFKPIPYFHASTLHTYLTCTHLYPAQNRIFSMKNLYTPVSVSVQLWPIIGHSCTDTDTGVYRVSGIRHLLGIGLTLTTTATATTIACFLV